MKTRKLLTILLLILIVSLLIVTIVQALTVTPVGGGVYNVTFSNGRTAIVYNVDYKANTKILSFQVNTSDGRGLRMKDIFEIREYVATLKGRTGLKDKTTIIIR